MVVGMQMPLHTIIEIQMGVTGVQEKRYKLMETQSEHFFFPPLLTIVFKTHHTRFYHRLLNWHFVVELDLEKTCSKDWW